MTWVGNSREIKDTEYLYYLTKFEENGLPHTIPGMGTEPCPNQLEIMPIGPEPHKGDLHLKGEFLMPWRASVLLGYPMSISLDVFLYTLPVPSRHDARAPLPSWTGGRWTLTVDFGEIMNVLLVKPYASGALDNNLIWRRFRQTAIGYFNNFVPLKWDIVVGVEKLEDQSNLYWDALIEAAIVVTISPSAAPPKPLWDGANPEPRQHPIQSEADWEIV